MADVLEANIEAEEAMVAFRMCIWVVDLHMYNYILFLIYIITSETENHQYSTQEWQESQGYCKHQIAPLWNHVDNHDEGPEVVAYV